MKIKDIKPNDVLVSVDEYGAAYYRVLKVNRVTVNVRTENGNVARMPPHLFSRKISYPVNV
jgi:hypothetical protein